MTDKQWENTLIWDGRNLKTAPTREQLAREWAERIMSTTLEMIDPVQRAAAEHILATTNKPTMADIQWCPAAHELAGATDGHTEVVMLDLQADNEHNAPELYVCDPSGHGGITRDDNLATYTPNGKRYRLVEHTNHPNVLTTAEEYEAAPAGTVVSEPGKGYRTFCKHNKLWYATGWTGGQDEHDMACNPRNVLRWGWGNEA